MAMKSYNQFCPVAKAADIFCERWTALILRDLGLGSTRFSELQRGVPLASPTLLAQRLRQLEAEGIVMRRRSADGRSWTYHLTRAGQEFVPIVRALGVWGQRWSRRTLRKGEMNVMLLLWELEQFAHPECFSATNGRSSSSNLPISRNTSGAGGFSMRAAAASSASSRLTGKHNCMWRCRFPT
jgi:DNA-binding HxlR family transcriptional regulator